MIELDFKLRNSKLDIEFLETRPKNGLMQKFVNFKVANSTLHNSKSYKDYQLVEVITARTEKCRSEK